MEKCPAYNDVKINEYSEKDWQFVELPQFSFYIPHGFSKKKSKCYDGPCHGFEDGLRHIGVDINTGVFGPSFERGLPSYEEKWTCVSGRRALIWHREQDDFSNSKYKYVSAVLFQYDEKRRLAVVYLSKTAHEKQTAENIFTSIRFKK